MLKKDYKNILQFLADEKVKAYRHHRLATEKMASQLL